MDLFTINNKVQQALEKLFQQHRLAFWYDEKAEMTGLFDSLQIPEIEKVVIENNEFTLKHRLLIEQPNQRFLLYQANTKPIDNENWLLDLLLSNYEFHTEASSLYPRLCIRKFNLLVNLLKINPLEQVLFQTFLMLCIRT